MWAKIKSVFKAVGSFFSGGGSVSDPPTQTPPGETPEPIDPIVNVPPPVAGVVDWLEWTKQAMLYSGAFEGKGEDWGNPVGNFDGAYLTCGLLGFTWKYNNQPPMILEFVKRYGVKRAKELMPRCWDDYYRAAKLGVSGGASIVSRWSSGSDNDERVYEPYRSELLAFWSSPEMRPIQIEKAWDMMGAWAKEKALVAQAYWNLPAPLFQHFEYYFDQAVLNGQGGYVKLKDAAAVSDTKVLSFCGSKSGYTVNDLRRNGRLWPSVIIEADSHEVVLWKGAYLRSLQSRNEFQPVTMNRRGTLALGKGWVNGTLRNYFWLGKDPEPAKPAVRAALEIMNKQ
ncbi:hypothetical protein Bb109J_c1941 [Bdellovibrio bacteriovorus]|nr:hypothetical protein EP01_06730 [Bdellovibrio bacteriovorus]BEV68521.1 hypothetical protein Bb109J_c1941 [Bdellovibrio bacteriovorus]